MAAAILHDLEEDFRYPFATAMLIQLIYRSKVSRQVRLSDAEKIAEAASTTNASADVSGLLLYTPTHFIQVLEGDDAVVRRLFSKIEKDERHQQIEIIADRPITERQFGEWGMRIGMPRKETSAATLDALDETAALNLLLDTIAKSNSRAPGAGEA